MKQKTGFQKHKKIHKFQIHESINLVTIDSQKLIS